MMIVRIVLILFILLLGAKAAMFQTVPEEKATLIQPGKDKYACFNCGMHLVKFYKTSHAHENNQYCSIHCLYEATQGAVPANAKAVDTISLELIDVKKAFYVVGSNIRGTMTRNSSYAFGSEKEAFEFASINGGRIMKFEEAYAVAGEDFPRGMFQPKVAPKPVVTEKIEAPKDAKCPVCGMFVGKYPQWVTMVDTGSKVFYFDGVKDMMKYYFSQKIDAEKFFVSDYYKLSKLEAQKAFYVVGSNVYGPMGAELIPFSSEQDAQTFARDHGGKMIVRFHEISEKIIKNP